MVEELGIYVCTAVRNLTSCFGTQSQRRTFGRRGFSHETGFHPLRHLHQLYVWLRPIDLPILSHDAAHLSANEDDMAVVYVEMTVL